MLISLVNLHRECLNLIRRKNKRLESEQTDDDIFSLKEKQQKDITLTMREKIYELEEEIKKLKKENIGLRFKIKRLK